MRSLFESPLDSTMYVLCFILLYYIIAYLLFLERFSSVSFQADGSLLILVLISSSAQLGPKFMRENGLKHVTFSTADGALEAAPAVRNCFLLYNQEIFFLLLVVSFSSFYKQIIVCFVRQFQSLKYQQTEGMNFC